ncbi:MAG: TIGR00730 family Rossman fold protein [Phenylobacterium sp.]|uniref:LOG family protein n=1 Tax=Phenylobacterium sp. TaxID=1871053 RepID=UPI002737575F|nr:TIGR00730 family Rossman fold protein [Phenylobacterium sp.]MDP1643593.1 TIGR00730 family Rossman fold protein [Phenylobacterium sp.]MDP3117757.1 TIGR00730 family Rossman fold protein [Phenylobacterium sp.]
MGASPPSIESVCVFCGSSDAADPTLLSDAAAFGRVLADQGRRLIYGGGGVGLMGACARAAHEAGGDVLGIIPEFLTSRERALDVVETIVVRSMHERKQIMFERSDGFVVLPGGIGTLEEIIELLSWRRLDLHRKPVVFYSPEGFWDPLFKLLEHTVAARLTPPDFMDSWAVAGAVDEILPRLDGRLAQGDVEAAALTTTRVT